MTSTDTYRAPKTLSILAIAPLAGILAINVLHIFLSLGEIVFPRALDIGSVSIWLAGMGMLSLLEQLLRIFAAVFFLVWLFRIYKNLGPLKADYLEHSPGWAVGYWFIPILNLFKPYQIVQEAWRESDPDFDPELNFLSRHSGTNPMILGWWLLYIVSNISVRVADAIFDKTSMGYFALSMMITGFLVATAAFLAITVVRDITRRQEERAKKLSTLESFNMPPPPPNFT